MPFTAARRATAEHMRRSLDTGAHALVATEVDYHAVDRVRSATPLSYLPFVARAVVDALRAFPLLNASVGDDCLIVHRKIHLGIAVDVDGEALVVPVVRDADLLRLSGLADAIAGVAARARAHRLALDELTGATFTLTNVGASGTLVTTPIINQPQVAILLHRRRAAEAGRLRRARRGVGRHRPSGRQPLTQLRPPGGRRRLRGGLPGPGARHAAGPRLVQEV